MDLPDYLPISMLNQLEYCERRFWLMYVCGEMEVNLDQPPNQRSEEPSLSNRTTNEEILDLEFTNRENFSAVGTACPHLRSASLR